MDRRAPPPITTRAATEAEATLAVASMRASGAAPGGGRRRIGSSDPRVRDVRLVDDQPRRAGQRRVPGRCDDCRRPRACS
jgi:hypothetical protein